MLRWRNEEFCAGLLLLLRVFAHAASFSGRGGTRQRARVLCRGAVSDSASARRDGQQPAHGVGGLMAIGAAPACIVHCDRRICDH